MANPQEASPQSLKPDLEKVLQEIYGFTFRGKQEEVCNALVRDRRDVCVVWATGSGKSVCYQLPALALGTTAVVISPLISLMQDQVAGINARCNGAVATHLSSVQTDPNAERKAYEGSYRLVYATPEKAASEGFLRGLESLRAQSRLAVVAIDEAHCISESAPPCSASLSRKSRVRRSFYVSQKHTFSSIETSAFVEPFAKNEKEGEEISINTFQYV
jgi:superfamily II DNA helicase RecQ